MGDVGGQGGEGRFLVRDHRGDVTVQLLDRQAFGFGQAARLGKAGEDQGDRALGEHLPALECAGRRRRRSPALDGVAQAGDAGAEIQGLREVGLALLGRADAPLDELVEGLEVEDQRALVVVQGLEDLWGDAEPLELAGELIHLGDLVAKPAHHDLALRLRVGEHQRGGAGDDLLALAPQRRGHGRRRQVDDGGPVEGVAEVHERVDTEDAGHDG